jgi:hypothetical protein
VEHCLPARSAQFAYWVRPPPPRPFENPIRRPEPVLQNQITRVFLGLQCRARAGNVSAVRMEWGQLGTTRTCSCDATEFSWRAFFGANCHTTAVTAAAAAPSIRFYPLCNCCTSAPQLSLSVFTRAILLLPCCAMSAPCELQCQVNSVRKRPFTIFASHFPAFQTGK